MSPTGKFRCSRCPKLYRGRGDWNVETRQGVIVALLCPSCQTPEENAEAEINAATVDYGQDAFGRVIGKPRNGGDQR